jgi:hypothetical protein
MNKEIAKELDASNAKVLHKDFQGRIVRAILTMKLLKWMK